MKPLTAQQKRVLEGNLKRWTRMVREWTAELKKLKPTYDAQRDVDVDEDVLCDFKNAAYNCQNAFENLHASCDGQVKSVDILYRDFANGLFVVAQRSGLQPGHRVCQYVITDMNVTLALEVGKKPPLTDLLSPADLLAL